MKKYAFVGTHGAGKTTIVNALRDRFLRDFPEKKIEVINEVARECPFDISDKENGAQGSIATYLWITFEQIQKELVAELSEPDYIICDRSVIDPEMYHEGDFDYLHTCIMHLVDCYMDDEYDKIFVLHTEDDMRIVDDNRRCMDIEFRNKVNDLFLDHFEEHESENVFLIPSKELFSEEGQKLVDKIYAECFLGL